MIILHEAATSKDPLGMLSNSLDLPKNLTKNRNPSFQLRLQRWWNPRSWLFPWKLSPLCLGWLTGKSTMVKLCEISNKRVSVLQSLLGHADSKVSGPSPATWVSWSSHLSRLGIRIWTSDGILIRRMKLNQTWDSVCTAAAWDTLLWSKSQVLPAWQCKLEEIALRSKAVHQEDTPGCVNSF